MVVFGIIFKKKVHTYFLTTKKKVAVMARLLEMKMKSESGSFNLFCIVNELRDKSDTAFLCVFTKKICVYRKNRKHCSMHAKPVVSGITL